MDQVRAPGATCVGLAGVPMRREPRLFLSSFTVGRSRAMIAATRRDGNSVLGWLRLLGWRIEIQRDGGAWTGVARRLDDCARELRVGSSAADYREVVSELYNGA